jgi:hypothetical protein
MIFYQVSSVPVLPMRNYHDPEADYWKRPIAFETQLELYQWLLQVRAEELSEVDSLSFTLMVPSHFDAELELENVKTALRKLPNVKYLFLHKRPEDTFNRTHHQLYDEILRSLGRIYPRLHAIGAHTDDHSLNFLRSLEHLRKLQFTGFATNTPMETLSVLSRLRHLVHIEIVPTLNSTAPSPTRGVPCLSREVLRSLRNVKHITLRETRAIDISAPAFFTIPFLQSLAGMTRAPLTRLSVELTDFAPDDSVVQTFGSFLASSHLRQLSLHWGNGGSASEAALLDALPRSLVHLSVNRVDVVGLETVSWKRRARMLPSLQGLTIKLMEEDNAVRMTLIERDEPILITIQLLNDIEAGQRARVALDELRGSGVQVNFIT